MNEFKPTPAELKLLAEMADEAEVAVKFLPEQDATPDEAFELGKVAGYDEREEEVAEYVILTDRMGEILTATADALKGKPGPLSLHSWHDLAEVAANLVAERDALTAVIEQISLLVKDTDGEWLDAEDFGCLAGAIQAVLDEVSE
jgi:hypothetical protein